MTQIIEIIRGTSNKFNITVTDANDEPYILTNGEKLRFGVKRSPKDKEQIISKTVISGTEGVYTVELDPTDTADLDYGRFVYDVGLESGEEYYNIIEASPFVIKPSVTKWGDGS